MNDYFVCQSYCCCFDAQIDDCSAECLFYGCCWHCDNDECDECVYKEMQEVENNADI